MFRSASAITAVECDFFYNAAVEFLQQSDNNLKRSDENMPHGGYQGIDWEANIDYSRMRRERLERARKSMKEKGLSAIICYDFDNIRYITGTHIGEWNRDKMNRYCILIDGVD